MNINKLDEKDITFLLNGKYDQYTKKSILSIKKHYPDAKIIVSCWENDPIDQNPNVDKFVVNEDPGGLYYKKSTSKLFKQSLDVGVNHNRISHAVKEGLKHVETKYVVRMRNDLIFLNNNLLNDFFSVFSKRDNEYSLFKNRIVVSSFFCQNYNFLLTERKINYMYFAVSDWLHFGFTEDVKEYWEPVEQIEDLESFAFEHGNKSFFPLTEFPETYFTRFSFKQKTKKTIFDVPFGNDEKIKKEGDKYFYENFILLSPKQLGFYNAKKQYKIISRHLGEDFGNRRYIDFLKYYINQYEKEWQIQKRNIFDYSNKMKLNKELPKSDFLFLLSMSFWFIRYQFRKILVLLFYKIFFVFSFKNILQLKQKK
ncbi:WavE lipopolysaccharide synthesis family protein [Mycoplasma procyoni]|uniref:WavE lipopolysaccharide synthesis family protein n=1 Tax=Mycoplasma procyoni TaxID=568784 RepID=UPI00197B8973|nr:WavE lipopolysaccharide synthesis family protein [Mycoplasma procyoni]MBN3535091.1 hypothetical protein [Mycoplasma procyoni]